VEQTARDQEERPVESLDQLVEWFHAAFRPRSRWRVGTEHELIGVSRAVDRFAMALPYEGEAGIAALLDSLAVRPFRRWEPVREQGNVIALRRDDAMVTLEPGGQIELSGRPCASASDNRDDVEAFLNQLAEPSRRLGVAWLGVGFRPFGRLDQVPWMPKERYRIMRAYLPTRGRLAHEMMKRTATVQVNLDYAGPDDAARKLRCAMGISPILTAIYANSPIVDGAIAPYQSYRARVWQETDADRCGLLALAFAGGDVFRAYTEWALDVPMFFVRRGGYLPAHGISFRRFLREGLAGHRATLDDWALHLSTLFPEVRFKPFIELRGCDAGSVPMVLALTPLAKGILYDDTALTAATGLTERLSFDQRLRLVEDVARIGLAARVGGGHTVGVLARELVEIAADGLTRIAPDEIEFLEPVQALVASGRTQADALVELWRRVAGDPARVIAEIAHPYPSCGPSGC
jgi:glutamate--cysteine ligase